MAPAKRSSALVFINGIRHVIGDSHAGWMLADYLRYCHQLMGTKIVCAEGDCGACTVLRYFPGFGKHGRSPAFLPVNSCILTMAQLDGSSLVTVDALARGTVLTPVQEAMKQCHGSQCGFCTPGFVMALSGLVEKKLARGEQGALDAKEAKNALTGNLCRCTGYQQIVQAAESVMVESCESVSERFYSRAQEKELRAALAKPLDIRGEGFRFFAPTTLKAATAFLAKEKSARVLGAATDLGVVHNKAKIRLEKLVSLHLIPKLYELRAGRGGLLRVGARVTLTELRDFLRDRAPEAARFLDLFASPQIKNVATLVGNVANASPIADTPPFLLSCDAVALITGPKGKRAVPLAEFYLGYRKTALRPGELLTGVELFLPAANDAFALYKVSERKDLDISSVNAGFRIQREKGRIREARVALGGVAATPMRLARTERLLTGAELSADLVEKAVRSLQEEIQPLSDVRGSAAFRRVLAGNLLRRFFREKVLGGQA